MYEALYEMHQKAFGPLYKGDQLCVDNAGVLVGLVPQQQQAPPFVHRSTVNDLSGADSADDDVQSLAAVDEDEAGGDGGPSSRSRSFEDSEKMSRRAIANSNERRRMQSINAGFQQLKDLVRPGDTEKLSKAAILQHAVDFIRKLIKDRRSLSIDNDRLSRLLSTEPSTGANVSPRQPRLGHTAQTEDERQHHPQLKRVRLHDDSTSYLSSSSSTSSVSSDEGVAELSSANDVGVVAGTRQSESQQPPTDVDAAKRRRRRADRNRSDIIENTVCQSRLDGFTSTTYAIDQLTRAYGDVWNQGTVLGVMASNAQPKIESGEIQQKLIDSTIDIGASSSRVGFSRQVSTSGDAVVPIAADDKVDVKPDDQMFGSITDHHQRWSAIDDMGGLHRAFSSSVDRTANDCRATSPSSLLPSPSTMSQRNLETILKAISYLEGDSLSSRPMMTAVGHETMQR